MKYHICCHTRDFEWINEFIQHHLDLGFDKIVIYDNMSVNPVEFNDPRVEIIKWDIPIVDFATYNDYLSKHQEADVWTAFIDEDEFINTNGKTIHEVMEKFKYWDALGLNWRVFGDKVDEDNVGKTLKEKYLYHIPISAETSWHIKTFCRNTAVVDFHHPHFPIYKKGKHCLGVKGNLIPQAWSKPDWSIIWIDHYYLRGKEEYIKRQTRWIDVLGVRTEQWAIERYEEHNSLATEKLKL